MRLKYTEEEKKKKPQTKPKMSLCGSCGVTQQAL